MSATPPRAVIHGHFYQPPREDPWLGEVPLQPNAAPWHDWNQRIERECYRAMVTARVLDAAGHIERSINTLEYMSFDVGPTLFEWMERAAPDTYRAILDADRRSVERTGHGNAIAHPYHHVILPLASRRDKETEVRWGIADFTKRFGRPPEGMWLPETAVDDETLDVLAQEGIRFTILAPSQVKEAPPHGRMGRCVTASGRSIAVGIYDGGLSHGVAFGRLLTDATVWRREMLEAATREGPDATVAIATDGETYGHHHRFGEMALAWLIDDANRSGTFGMTNFGAILEATPPSDDVEIVTPSSWSCVHGVERWRANCGCRVAQDVPPRQEWRAPLREALDGLRAMLDGVFAGEGARLFGDPWRARDRYGAVVNAPAADRRSFVRSLLVPDVPDGSLDRACNLLEMARDALRMYTSCAWFFDRVDGLEPAQNLRYAARAIQLAGGDAASATAALLAALRSAHGSEPGAVSAADIFGRDVLPQAIRESAGAGPDERGRGPRPST